MLCRYVWCVDWCGGKGSNIIKCELKKEGVWIHLLYKVLCVLCMYVYYIYVCVCVCIYIFSIYIYLLSVSMCLCVSLSLSCVSLYLSVCLSLSLCLSLCLCLSVSLCLCVSLSLSLSVVSVSLRGGPLSALRCVRETLIGDKKISPLIYSQSWVGSWVYTTQAMMTFTPWYFSADVYLAELHCRGRERVFELEARSPWWTDC